MRSCRYLAFMLATATAASVTVAHGQSSLAVGPDAGGYTCPDGREIYVSRCYDNSLTASCQFTRLDTPRRNGFQPESAATRSELLTSLRNCTVVPVKLDADGVRLIGTSPARNPVVVAEATTPALLHDVFPSDDPDATARFDNLAIELQRDPSQDGYLIFYGRGLSRPEDVQKTADDALAYLSNERLIDPQRLHAIFGGGRQVPTTELWIMQRGGSPPKPTPTIKK